MPEGAIDVATQGMEDWIEDRYNKWPGVYWGNWRGPEIANAVGRLIALKEMPPLTEQSTVFEAGCNLGQCLYALWEKYHCRLIGLDVSPRAIAGARKCLPESSWLIEDNALTSAWLAGLVDQCFDLVFTRWHLLHIPRSPLKTAYVNHLKRVAKTFVMFEPDDRVDIDSRQGGMTVVFERWDRVYGMRKVDTLPHNVKHTSVFIDHGGAPSQV